jgi:hypothetical protein
MWEDVTQLNVLLVVDDSRRCSHSNKVFGCLKNSEIASSLSSLANCVPGGRKLSKAEAEPPTPFSIKPLSSNRHHLLIPCPGNIPPKNYWVMSDSFFK